MPSSLIALLVGAVVLAALVAGCVDMASSDLMRQVRGRLTLSMAVFVGTALASWWVLWTLPALSGMLFMISPGVAAVIGIAIFALVPFRDRRPALIRTASLSTRTRASVLTRRALTAPAVTLAVLTATLTATGLSADPTIGITLPVTSGYSVGPYPGWPYGGPILITAAALVAATALALRRAILIPTTTAPEADQERWRRRVGSTLGAILTCGLLLYLAEVVWIIGRSFIYATRVSPSNPPPNVALLSAAGTTLGVITPLILVAAAAVLIQAGVRLRRPARILTSSAGPA